MKKQYTKKQITEAIKHWKGVLRKMNENIDNIKSLSLDIASEMYDSKGKYIGIMTNDQFIKWMDEVSNKYNVKYKILSFHGSGGGYPDVKFTGKESDLKKLYEEWYVNGEQACETWEEIRDTL